MAFSDVRQRLLKTSFAGVFFQQEFESPFDQISPLDSTGNLFTYYEPKLIDPALVTQVVSERSKIGQWMHRTQKAFGSKDFDIFSLDEQLKYLELLADKFEREFGVQTVWGSERDFLLLVRKPSAPSYLALNPSFEPDFGQMMIDAKKTTLTKLQITLRLPEIKTAKDQPALSVAETTQRAQQVIAATGHTGMHEHVFFRIPPEVLKSRESSINQVLTFLNLVAFTTQLHLSREFLTQSALTVWHEHKSQRLSEILNLESEERISQPRSIYSTKAAGIAFRYWGKTNGDALISLEIRSLLAPPKRAAVHFKGLEDGAVDRQQRDFRLLEDVLLAAALVAEAFGQRRNIQLPFEPLKLDIIDSSLLRKAGTSIGLSDGDYFDASTVLKLMSEINPEFKTNDGYINPNLLVPFILGENSGMRVASQAFLKEFAKFSLELKRISAHPGAKRQESRYLTQLLYETYLVWAEHASPVFYTLLQQFILNLEQVRSKPL